MVNFRFNGNHSSIASELQFEPPAEREANSKSIGILISGGLDSSILLKHLLDTGYRVQPFYISSGLCWQTAERRALEQYLKAVAVRRLEPLAVLELPLTDVYGDHWSITGRDVPEAGTPDEAVFLPGRNAFLTIKAALWCQIHGIAQLALATLRSNPFGDASSAYFARLEEVLSEVGPRPIQLVRPFGKLNKRQVMELGRNYPLGLTFSCLAPREDAHCGQCNKCAERQMAFHLIRSEDPTYYVHAKVSCRVEDDNSSRMEFDESSSVATNH